MKFNTYLIIWHHKEPVFSVDFHESGRIATGGADNTVKVCFIIPSLFKPLIYYLILYMI